MSLMAATIRYYGPLAKKIRGMRPVVKEALQKAVVAWHHGGEDAFKTGGFLPFHFDRRAPYRYTGDGIYKQRTFKYERRKHAKYGHNNPLEFTGQTKRAVMASIRISGSSQRVRGTMTGTNVLNFQGSGKGVHNLRGELLATNKAEEQVLADGVAKIVSEWLNREDEVSTKRA